MDSYFVHGLRCFISILIETTNKIVYLITVFWSVSEKNSWKVNLLCLLRNQPSQVSGNAHFAEKNIAFSPFNFLKFSICLQLKIVLYKI